MQASNMTVREAGAQLLNVAKAAASEKFWFGAQTVKLSFWASVEYCRVNTGVAQAWAHENYWVCVLSVISILLASSYMHRWGWVIRWPVSKPCGLLYWYARRIWYRATTVAVPLKPAITNKISPEDGVIYYYDQAGVKHLAVPATVVDSAGGVTATYNVKPITGVESAIAGSRMSVAAQIPQGLVQIGFMVDGTFKHSGWGLRVGTTERTALVTVSHVLLGNSYTCESETGFALPHPVLRNPKTGKTIALTRQGLLGFSKLYKQYTLEEVAPGCMFDVLALVLSDDALWCNLGIQAFGVKNVSRVIRPVCLYGHNPRGVVSFSLGEMSGLFGDKGLYGHTASTAAGWSGTPVFTQLAAGRLACLGLHCAGVEGDEATHNACVPAAMIEVILQEAGILASPEIIATGIKDAIKLESAEKGVRQLGYNDLREKIRAEESDEEAEEETFDQQADLIDAPRTVHKAHERHLQARAGKTFRGRKGDANSALREETALRLQAALSLDQPLVFDRHGYKKVIKGDTRPYAESVKQCRRPKDLLGDRKPADFLLVNKLFTRWVEDPTDLDNIREATSLNPCDVHRHLLHLFWYTETTRKFAYCQDGDNYPMQCGELFAKKVATVDLHVGGSQPSSVIDDHRAAAAAKIGVNMADFPLPATGPEAIKDSLRAQALEQRPTSFRGMTHHDEAFDRFLDSYPSTEAPEDLAVKMAEALEAFDSDAGLGWTRFALGKSTKGDYQAKRGFPEQAKAIILVALERLFLRVVVTPEVACWLRPADLVALGYNDPKTLMVKKEPHKKAKALQKRWRLIWMVSLVDSIITQTIHGPQNKADIAAYQAGDLHVQAVGMGHHDEGVERLGATLDKVMKEGKLTGADAKGWDLSVRRDPLYMDAVRRCECSLSQGFWFCDLIMSEFVQASSHVLHVGNEIIEMQIFGVTASGTPSTSAQNSVMRSGTIALGLGVEACANGDDVFTEPNAELEKLDPFGPTTRDIETESFLNFTSHRYEKTERGWEAIFQNFEKSVVKFLVEPEKNTKEKIAGLKYCLRKSPEDLKRFHILCTELGFDFDGIDAMQTCAIHEIVG